MPAIKARQITPTTIKRLFALSGNRCAFPDCNITIVQKDSSDLMTQICHIEAAEPDGQRYNAAQTDEERRHFDNLVLFCPNHHVKTNDVTVYTADILKKIKKEHENKMLLQFANDGVMNKYPAGLATIINQISLSGLFNKEPEHDENLTTFKIEDKILYNDIKEHKGILDEYKVYQGKLNKIYEQIEIEGSFKKIHLLTNIKSLYLKAKGKYTDGTIESIRMQADKLFNEVEKSLWLIIDKSNNLNEDVSYEAMELSVQIILVDAFMRCKILEEPK